MTLSMCTNKPTLDNIISALGVDAEPHWQTPGLCHSICPLCSCSDASGDSTSLATVGFATAAATRSPMVRDLSHGFLSIFETPRNYADCCCFERMYVPMEIIQIKRSRRVGVEGWKSAWQEAHRNALALRFGHFTSSDFRRGLRLSQHAQHRSHHINSNQATPKTATALQRGSPSHLNLDPFLKTSPTASLWV